MTPKPDSMWLVVYETRWDVVRVSPQGDGFFAPGQEPCWHMDNAVWIREIKQTPEEEIEADKMVYGVRKREGPTNDPVL